MKILITGANGQVGSALVKTLIDHNVIPISREQCNLKNKNDIKTIIDFHKPDLIINSAAYTKVDCAEEEKDIVFQINSEAPRIMAERALKHKIPFIHFSTDYVFDGNKQYPYIETDYTKPLNIYGQSKLAGEKGIQEIDGQFYIFRTSWVYSNTGKNFYLNIKKLIDEKKQLSVVSNQHGVPTSSYFIARQIDKIITQLHPSNKGIYHLVPNGKCSWFGFAKLIARKNPNFDLNKLNSISANDYSRNVIRPQNSVLNNHKIQSTFMLEFSEWEFELDRMINET